MNGVSNLQKNVHPYGLQGQWYPGNLTIQFNHQINHKNIQAWAQVHVWAFHTVPQQLPRLGTPTACCVPRCCSMGMDALDMLQPSPPTPLPPWCSTGLRVFLHSSSTSTEPFCFLDHPSKTHQVCWITLCAPGIWEVWRKAPSQDRLAFFCNSE